MKSEHFVLLSVAYFVVIIGLLLNGFIVITNLFLWMKQKALQNINVLLTSLGLLRLILLSLYMQHIGFLLSGGSVFKVENPDYLGTFATCVIFCNLWWGSVLCFFYCVKITNYSNRLFIKIKMNISKMVPWLLLISLVISFIFSLPYSLSLLSSVVNSTDNVNGTMRVNVVNVLIVIFAGSIVPFMICCVAIYLIFVSLLRHTRNMSGFSDAQRDLHLRVMWSMVSFLLFYTLYIAAYLLIIHLIENTTWYLLCFMYIYAYPSLHSIILIFSNRELKETFFLVFSLSWLWKLRQENL